MQYTVDTPPCTTIPLHPLCPLHPLHPLHTVSSASTGLTLLHQRQCPHHHIPLFYCMHCVLCPLCTASTGLTFLHQRQCPHHHIPLFYCILRTASTEYCIHWFDLFAPKTMSLPPYTTIPLRTASTASTGLTFLHQTQCSYHHMPLFHCILHPLHLLV